MRYMVIGAPCGDQCGDTFNTPQEAFEEILDHAKAIFNTYRTDMKTASVFEVLEYLHDQYKIKEES